MDNLGHGRESFVGAHCSSLVILSGYSYTLATVDTMFDIDGKILGIKRYRWSRGASVDLSLQKIYKRRAFRLM